ncbi:hypothetical protein [Bradyrhizobium yuanmingense]|uniref:hypothetical protein n=1 Tax=Bradyrhizobium yuanmingense TaxID=108015 RepID=UPI0023B9991F|nr:hypothetical protein [Bradyrhizobium yuanmingense]MDF0497255.1 hypothetical protein [Bradyrhizobium yuanmingense]MDF0521065.1 hypothetical protein [Bradyrhizobium yuanmingense]
MVLVNTTLMMLMFANLELMNINFAAGARSLLLAQKNVASFNERDGHEAVARFGAPEGIPPYPVQAMSFMRTSTVDLLPIKLMEGTAYPERRFTCAIGDRVRNSTATFPHQAGTPTIKLPVCGPNGPVEMWRSTELSSGGMVALAVAVILLVILIETLSARIRK